MQTMQISKYIFTSIFIFMCPIKLMLLGNVQGLRLITPGFTCALWLEFTRLLNIF